MRLFYCPKCNKEKISTNDIYRGEYTISNMRGGYGRPIRHYKCECGNYFAGSIDISGWEDDEDSIKYCKDTINEYNKNGCFYNLSIENGIDPFERAKQVYEERKIDE